MSSTRQTKKVKELQVLKEKVAKQLPPMTAVLRGTFIESYLECIRPNCKCHKNKKYRHGPYYRVSYGKWNRVRHVYVPLRNKKKAKEWVKNYNRIWQGIEEISEINTKLIQIEK